MSGFHRMSLRFVLRTSIAALYLLTPISARGQVPSLLWYGGDAAQVGSFFNNTRVSADFGFSVLDDFVVSNVAGWHITGLFSNNVATYPIETYPFTQAVWSIRTGVGPGEPGDILFAGVSPVIVTPTGRTFGGNVEYSVVVSGLSIDLGPGVYFMSVSPIQVVQVYHVPQSDGTNAVGSPGPSGLFQEDRVLVGSNLQYTVSGPASEIASMGVIGWVHQINDSDRDGVPDGVDRCRSSDLSTSVTINSCNSGVNNTLFPSGCTIADLIASCAESAGTHGDFVTCASDLTNDLQRVGTISGRQKGAIQSCAAQPDTSKRQR